MVSHLLFTDDKILFCDVNMNHHINIRSVLCFKAVLGLRVKSEQVRVGSCWGGGVDRGIGRSVILKMESLPVQHLGIPLDSSFKAL